MCFVDKYHAICYDLDILGKSMPRILSIKSSHQAPTLNRTNILTSIWDWFRSLDRFVQLSIIVFIALFIALNAIVAQRLHWFNYAATSSISLFIDYNAATKPFNNDILGQGYVNLALGRLVESNGTNIVFDVSQVPGLIQATTALKPGIIRIGGDWVNEVGWSRTPPCGTLTNQYCDWSATGSSMRYHFSYYPALVDKLVQETAELGAHALILNINVSDNNPSMWSDMVNYVKAQKTANILDYNNITIYFELGNELDLDKTLYYSTFPPSVSLPHLLGSAYVTKFNPYQQAMLASEPNALVIGPTVSNAQETTWSSTGHALSSNMSPFFGNLATSSYAALPAMSFHWYETCNVAATAANIPSILNWQTYSGIDLNTSQYNEGSRHYPDILASRIRNEQLANTRSANAKLFIDEHNVDGCVNGSNANLGSAFNGDFIGALFMADVLPRMTYNGIDGATSYEGYGTDNLSLIYPDNSLSPTKVFLRPAYIPYLLYAQFFDPNMLPVTPLNDPTATDYTDKNALSVWASKDSNNKELTMIVSNMTNAPIQVATTITNFPYPQLAGSYYQVISSVTTATTQDLTSPAATDSGSVFINGKRIDPMNVVNSLHAITPSQLPTSSFSGNVFTFTYPAYSITQIRLTSPAVPTPTPAPQPTATSTPSPLPTSTAVPTPTPTTVSSDIIPPSVVITAPATGSTVSRKSTITISATASDNVGVSKVLFYVNGQPKCTDTTAAYTCNWSVPATKTVSNYSLTATAYDAAGNSASSVVLVTAK